MSRVRKCRQQDGEHGTFALRQTGESSGLGETRLSQQETLCLYLERERERERERTEAKLTLSIFTKIFKTGFHPMKASPLTVDLNFDKTRDVNLLCLSSMTLSLTICNVESH